MYCSRDERSITWAFTSTQHYLFLSLFVCLVLLHTHALEHTNTYKHILFFFWVFHFILYVPLLEIKAGNNVIVWQQIRKLFELCVHSDCIWFQWGYQDICFNGLCMKLICFLYKGRWMKAKCVLCVPPSLRERFSLTFYHFNKRKI